MSIANRQYDAVFSSGFDNVACFPHRKQLLPYTVQPACEWFCRWICSAPVDSVMYYAFVGVMAIISPCFARPALSGPASQSLNATRPLMGFPAEYLPIDVTIPTNGTPGLALPLDPSHQRDLTQVITSSPGVVPRGIRLIGSIAVEIYGSWLDTSNHRIRKRIVVRNQGLEDFEFITQPSRYGGLTRLKVGIVYC